MLGRVWCVVALPIPAVSPTLILKAYDSCYAPEHEGFGSVDELGARRLRAPHAKVSGFGDGFVGVRSFDDAGLFAGQSRPGSNVVYGFDHVASNRNIGVFQFE